MNKFYTDTELEKLFGRRPGDGLALFWPMELGWVCPTGENHWLEWSEFKDHVWCVACEVDYFSPLCPKRMNPHTTESILREESESVAELMNEWTLERYKQFARDEFVQKKCIKPYK